MTNRLGVEIEFHVAPLHALTFLDRQSIDLCVSDAVFEHVQNLPAVMLETSRVLKPGGLVYAAYGPLWYCAGGDHFARGGLENVFNHVLLEPEAYKRYFDDHKQAKEGFQSGGRYVELDLFSRLKTSEYLGIYQDCGFEIDSLIFELSSWALRFKKQYPKLFDQLRVRNSHCTDDDFIIKANFVRLRKAVESHR